MRKFEGYVHGIDLGGWLSQCDYSQDRLDNFIKKSDIEKIKSWGLDHVRVPVDYNIFQSDDGKLIERGFECVQRCIDWCGEMGLNMILDLHKTRGFSFDKGEGEKNFFDDGQLQQAFYDLWEEFSRRYVKYADRLAFELLNEVTDQSYIDSWNRISGEAIKVIRKYSRDVKIIVGS
jgi:aryl-phospho-beta-D-glucosidase BglC (GH1 family)